jgi:predicted YcjX-like family ATPase
MLRALSRVPACGNTRARVLCKGQQAGQGARVGLSQIADGIWRQVEAVQDKVSGAFFEPVIRLGVTGLARSGKTVFITSLVANLLDRGRMPGLVAAAEGRIEAAFLQPQPDDTIARFEYEAHLGALTATSPAWPDSTRAVSELRLSLRVRPKGLLAGLQGARTVHLDIVDYPGEWLLDLGLLDLDYDAWSAQTLTRIAPRAQAQEYLALVAGTDAQAPLNEPVARALADQFAAYLVAARQAGFSDCTPGRFLLPGDLAGSPVLTFAPLPATGADARKGLRREMARRYEAYKREVVKPFFRDHFARIDRQVVLVDALGAINAGPPAVEDLRAAMAETLSAFRPGRNSFLRALVGARRVERILFAATKADHLHHSQHAQLTAIMEALTRDARERARFAGAKTQALAIASLRATTEDTMMHEGAELNVVRGTLLDTGRQAAFYPGALPDDPAQLLGPARAGAQKWLDADYRIMRFAPAPLRVRPGDGPPHIRLDRAAEFLIGDRL